MKKTISRRSSVDTPDAISDTQEKLNLAEARGGRKPRAPAKDTPLPIEVRMEQVAAAMRQELGGDDRPPLRPSSETAVFQVADLSFQKRHEESGRLLVGIAVDYHVSSGSEVVLSGWIAGDRTMLDLVRQSTNACLFRRPDVEDAFGGNAEAIHGFVAVFTASEDGYFTFLGLSVHMPPADTSPEILAHICDDHRTRLGFLAQALSQENPLRAHVIRCIEFAAPEFSAAKAHLEQVKGVPGHGGLLVGWSFAMPDVRLAIADHRGYFRFMDAVRWHRLDISEAFGAQYGNYANNAGFLTSWHDELVVGEPVFLLAVTGDSACILAQGQWELAPLDPVSFARWSFAVPTPTPRFDQRVARHDGPILNSLVATKLAGRADKPVQVREYGTMLTTPECSVIVPLYHRYDFMFNQMLAFSEDRFLRERAELVYVVDDPNLISQVENEAVGLFEANGVPFRLVSYGDNLGYAGANNMGVLHSRAPNILLLNSDVIPIEPRWLERMLRELQASPQTGIVGARLIYPNGSVQHEGMEFRWETGWNAFINHHPRIGLEIRDSGVKTSNQVAVTGACLLIRRSTYKEIGGLDEGFLIGDFEDSDLCLKVLKLGLDIKLVHNVELVHLERQSLVGVGGGQFRELVTRYNAARHQKRWGTQIAALLGASLAGG